jgi:dTDP-4-amino-4,6-dideoxygalactose transaminase
VGLGSGHCAQGGKFDARDQSSVYGHVRQYHSLKKELDEAIHQVLESNQYVMGPAVARFEQDLAKYAGSKYAIGLNSGTDALWLVFMALDVKPGDEIITTANTFFATAEAIWIAGAKAVFVDIDPVTRNIDPNRSRRPSPAAPSASCRCTCTACRPT